MNEQPFGKLLVLLSNDTIFKDEIDEVFMQIRESFFDKNIGLPNRGRTYNGNDKVKYKFIEGKPFEWERKISRTLAQKSYINDKNQFCIETINNNFTKIDCYDADSFYWIATSYSSSNSSMKVDVVIAPLDENSLKKIITITSSTGEKKVERFTLNMVEQCFNYKVKNRQHWSNSVDCELYFSDKVVAYQQVNDNMQQGKNILQQKNIEEEKKIEEEKYLQEERYMDDVPENEIKENVEYKMEDVEKKSSIEEIKQEYFNPDDEVVIYDSQTRENIDFSQSEMEQLDKKINNELETVDKKSDNDDLDDVVVIDSQSDKITYDKINGKTTYQENDLNRVKKNLSVEIESDNNKKRLSVNSIKNSKKYGVAIKYAIGDEISIKKWENDMIIGNSVAIDANYEYLKIEGEDKENFVYSTLFGDSVKIGNWSDDSFCSITVTNSKDNFAISSDDKAKTLTLNNDASLRLYADNKNQFAIANNGEEVTVGQYYNDEISGVKVKYNVHSKDISVINEDKEANEVSVFDKKGNLEYFGKCVEGSKAGFGVSVNLAEDEYFFGNWENNEKKGKGSIFYSNGMLKYQGDFAHSQKCGYGKFYDAGGFLIYKGTFKNDLYDGTGVLYAKNGTTISGDFSEGEVSGNATKTDSMNNVIYKGEWLYSVYDGNGMLKYDDGSYVVGEFCNNKLAGDAEKYSKYNKLLYKGGIFDDKYNGDGILYDDNEKVVYEGHFKNNLFDGEGKLYSENSCYSGEFSDNMKNGFGAILENNKVVFMGQWNDDKKNGVGIEYNVGQVEYVGNYVKNKKHGRVDKFIDGKIDRQSIFDNGTEIYSTIYNEKGLYYIGALKDGKPNGLGVTFNEYCQKIESGIFEDGKFKKPLTVQSRKLSPVTLITKFESIDQFKRIKENIIQYVVDKDFNGGVYSGEIKNGLPDGKGNIVCDDHVYVGDFVEGKANGNGELILLTGEIYKGEFGEAEGKKIKCGNNTYNFTEQN